MTDAVTRETAGQTPEAASAPLIAVRDLTKTYRSKREGLVEALAPVSFSVVDGEFVCLVGPSGCGKSTLLKILAGIVPRTSGSIDIRHRGRAAGDCHIGLVFQSPVLLPWRTVLQNTVLPADVLNLDRAAAERRARALLAMVGCRGSRSPIPPSSAAACSSAARSPARCCTIRRSC